MIPVNLEPLFLILLGSAISFLGVAYSIRRQWELVEGARKKEIQVENESNAINEARLRLKILNQRFFSKIGGGSDF